MNIFSSGQNQRKTDSDAADVERGSDCTIQCFDRRPENDGQQLGDIGQADYSVKQIHVTLKKISHSLES